jgi:hypothetical protein
VASHKVAIISDCYLYFYPNFGEKENDMNWDAIAAIAEVIGVVGIIVSIAYLGIQVRQSNRVAEDTSFQGILSLGNTSLRGMAESENRDIVIKGLLKYNELTAGDKLVFDTMMFGLFTTIECILLSNAKKLIRDEQPDTASFYLRTRFFPYSGTLSWWSDSKQLFAPEVQQWIDDQIRIADMNADYYGIKNDA